MTRFLNTVCLMLLVSSCVLTTSFDRYGTGAPEGMLYALTGTIDGLDTDEVTLLVNGAHATPFGNGPFVFPAVLHDGDGYAVTVGAQPVGATCAVSSGTGAIALADAGGVLVHCISQDATLADLEVAAGPLSPAFDPKIAMYSVSGKSSFVIPSITTTITAKAKRAGATITIASAPAPSGVATIAFKPGPNPIDIVVTAPDGMTTQKYTVVLNGAPNPNDYLKASNTRAGAQFGLSIAISGDTLAVGSFHESSSATGIDGDQTDTSAPNAGAVYVFVRTGVVWSQQAYIKASNTRAQSCFGRAVALSQDTLAVGAFQESSGSTGISGDQTDVSAPNAGAVYVFTRSGTTWSQQAYVKASNARSGGSFGSSVALSGQTLAVGAPGDSSVSADQNDTSAPSAGAVYVFTRSGTTWSQQAYAKASTPHAGDDFGFGVALSQNTLAVSAIFEASGATGINGDQSDTSGYRTGAAYVFTRSGTTWSQEAYVKSSTTHWNLFFGRAIALDGDTLVVGASGDPSGAVGIDGDQSDTSAPVAGAVWIFTRTKTTWTQQVYMKASNTRAQASFGVSVALLGDALVVGSLYESSNAIGINADQTDASAPQAGAAYFFTRSGTSWTQKSYIKASNTRTGASFGVSVALTADSLGVGAVYDSSNATGVNGSQGDTSAAQAGAVYVY